MTASTRIISTFIPSIHCTCHGMFCIFMLWGCREGKEEKIVMHVVGIPPTLESIKDSGLYLEPLQDCWHYQEVSWFDLYLINLFLSLSRSPSLSIAYMPTLLCHTHFSLYRLSSFFHLTAMQCESQIFCLSVLKKFIISGHSSIKWVKKASCSAPAHCPHLLNECVWKDWRQEMLLTTERWQKKNHSVLFCQAAASLDLFWGL